jgi:phage tail-like protein
MSDRPRDPLAGFAFRLTLGNVEIAGFSECTGLEMETRAFEYQEGGVNSHLLKFPEQTRVSNLVLKRGVTFSTELFDWYLDIARGRFSHSNQRTSAATEAGQGMDAGSRDTSRKIAVALLDADGEVAREWVFRRAFPVKWTGPDFTSTDSAVAFESIELAHEGFRESSA